MPEVSEGGRFGSGAGDEPLRAPGDENLLPRALGFHPAPVEEDPAGIEVTDLVARKNIRCEEHIVVVKGN